MSLLNGLSGFGAGLDALATNGLKDAETQVRIPLLNSAPEKKAAVEDAQAPSTEAAAVAAKAGIPLPSGVPAEYLPFYQEASKRTGIPVAVLVAQGKQESNFNPDAVGSAGEIGIAQIKPSTASSPGWGLKGIDPATLRDPRVAINFQADYMKARAGVGADFSDPKTIDLALASYNGGGDPRYTENVRRHMAA